MKNESLLLVDFAWLKLLGWESVTVAEFSEPWPARKNDSIIGDLTKRELFAALAMQGLLARDGHNLSLLRGTAEMAISFADALIAELERNAKACVK